MKVRNLVKGIATALAIAIVLPCAVFNNRVYADSNGIQTFVTSLYSDCLGRTPDPVGLNDWCTKLANGTISGKECAYGFFFSPEFRAKAETMPAGALVDTYYRVFLNRSADGAGKDYWMQRIAPTSVSDDIIILFNGFADSTEFANKCASYGITVGTVTTPAVSVGGGTTSGGASSAPATPATDTWTAVQNGTHRFGSASEMDAYFASRGCVVYNICGQKIYVQFYDTTTHAQMINNHRVANGQPALEIVTDPNDVRMQEARLRAVEAAYSFTHDLCNHATRPNYAMWLSENITSTPCDSAENNINSFNNFVNSDRHNRIMLKPIDYHTAVAVASCRIWVVSADGVSINPNGCSQNRTITNVYDNNTTYTMPNGYGTVTVQDFYLDGAYLY